MIEITLENFDKRFHLVCRFCLSDSDCIPLFLHDGGINQRLQKCFEIIASKVDENDGLPNNICSMCVQSIEDFVNFETSCSESYAILLKFMKELIDAENNDKQINVEVLEERIHPADDIESDAEEVLEIFEHVEQIDLADQPAIDEGFSAEPEELTNNSKESNKLSTEIPTEDVRNLVAEVIHEESHLTVSSSLPHSPTDEMYIKANNATVVDYCYRKDRKIPIVQCMFCNRTYRGRNTLRKHLKIHFQIKNYSCGFCDRTFSDRSSLRTHEVRHSTTKPFKCGHCDRAYYSQAELKQHTTSKHGHRKYVCAVCKKRFPSKVILQDHALGHQTDRPFVCRTCGKSFKRNRNLVKHYQIHEKAERVMNIDPADRSTQMVNCQYCEIVLTKPSKVLEHLIETHPDQYEKSRAGTHYCSSCPSKFDDLKDYLLHQDEHNLLVITVENNTVYQCGECGKQHRYRSLAEKHLQSHSADRRFQCNIEECSKKYKFKVHLARHMRLAHGEYQT